MGHNLKLECGSDLSHKAQPLTNRGKKSADHYIRSEDVCDIV